MQTVEQSIRPSVFFSYSRRDLSFVEEHLRRRGVVSSNDWMDMEQIALGENWMEQIRTGISEADEFILLASDASLNSPIVADELAAAKEYEKPIGLIVVGDISDEASLPEAHLHRIDLRGKCEREIEQLLAGFVRPHRPADQVDAMTVKSVAARFVWPEFVPNAAGDSRAHQALTVLSKAARQSPARSAVLLNYGLVECSLGNFDAGLEALEQHAVSADTAAAWYFLSLHKTRGRAIRSAKLQDARSGHEAAERSLSRANTVLGLLLVAIYRVAGANQSPKLLADVVAALPTLLEAPREQPSELVRFAALMKPNLPEFGVHSERLMSSLRKAVNG